MTTALTLPQPNAPLVDENGITTRSWWYYFQRLLTRTGGQSGGGGPLAPIVPTGSPFLYTSTAVGSLLIAGGGVARVRMKRLDAGWVKAGVWYVPFPVIVGDVIEIAYVRAPVVTFIPFGFT